MNEAEIDRLYRQGVASIRAGDFGIGKAKLKMVIEQDKLHEQAWLWLSAAVDNDEERIVCLENVLTINPSNEAARQGLLQLGVELPELPDAVPSPKTEPEPSEDILFASDMHAMIDGRSADSVRRDISDDESWRQALYSADYAPGESASFVPDLDKGRPSRTLSDLTNVWVDMLWLNTAGGFMDEVRHGGFGHVFANILAAGLLQMLSVLILWLLLSLLPSEQFQPPLLRSISDVIAEAGPVEMPEVESEQLGNYGLMLEFLGLDPARTVNNQIGQVEGNVASTQLAIAGMVGAILLVYLLLSIPLIFVSEMYRSIVTNIVAGWLRGAGDAVMTMHALTTATVVTQIVQLPIAVILPFLPLGTVLILSGALSLYQFLVSSVAIGKVHGFGLLLSMGVIILSQAVGGTLTACGAFAFGFLLTLSG